MSLLDDPTRSKLRGNSIGFVFQQFHLIPHLTAVGNVETALLYRDMRPKERKERCRAALEELGLGARADHRPVQMSGGEQQRVALARAIVTEPLMILADEPTGALDSTNAAHVLEIFSNLQSPERAVVMVTHDPTVARTAHRMISMRDGQIVGDERTDGYRPMSDFDDLVGVAWSGLRARKIRTLLIMLGPIIGVAAMVSAVGLTESAKGRCSSSCPNSAPTSSSSRPAGRSARRIRPFPSDAVERVENVSTVESASATTNLSGVIALPIKGASTYYEAFPVPVRASDDALPAVLGVPMISGRWLNASDTQLHTAWPSYWARASPSSTATCRERAGPSPSTGPTSAWWASSGRFPLDPELDNAAFVTQWAAQNIFHTNGQPNQLYVRIPAGCHPGHGERDPHRHQSRWTGPVVDPDPE